ncbi:MAG: RHS repeat-associated core domain-containing protein [Phycisphaerae bacterium]
MVTANKKTQGRMGRPDFTGGGSITAANALPGTNTQENWNLDGLGNWRAAGFLPVGGSQTTDQRSHNNLNEIAQRTLTGSGAITFQYDGATGASNGNLKNDGTLVYSYDAFNRPIQINRVSGGAVIGNYAYDALNRRIRKTVALGPIHVNNDGCHLFVSPYQTVYPSNGQNDTVSQEYNALGQVIQSTDRDGNVHQYTYDTAGREISDTVTTLGAGVDGSVRRIDTTYNAQGLAYLLTSYADTAGTQIVNQVENIYTGLGQLAFQYQAVIGAVDVGTTPFVEYTYTSPSNGSRITSMVYPNGRTIDYNYSGTNLNSALDNAIGRLDSISDGANSGDAGQVLQQYSYLGLSTIVAENDPQTGINLTYLGSAGSIGSGGDQYVGLDRFGRVVNQNWVAASTGTSTNDITYSYDNNSNVTAENNLLDSAYSQTFTYDPLNRLTANTLGGAAAQSWTLDSQGNWSSVTTNGVTQTRTANAQNQITSISGTTGTPVYDANGNMTTDQNGNTLVYNAWNQLVSVKNASGQLIAGYTYDARGYRISETYPLGGNGVAAGTVDYIYYDSQWQAIETRTGGTANSNVTSQTVWSASYINATVLQDTYSGGTLQANSRLYFEQDANWDTTAVVGYNATGGAWNVVQRYTYSPYGTITVLNADWSTPPSGTQPVVNNLYQGMTLDSVTGLYYARNRNYSPSLGTWISQDPLSYVNGANTYQFVMGNPVGKVDPSGTALVGAIWGGVSGAIAGYTGAAEGGGGLGAEVAGALFGGAAGAALGGIAPPGTGWAMAAGGLSAAAGNWVGQQFSSGGNATNWAQVAANGAAGAISEGVLAPVNDALSELESSGLNSLFQGANSLLRGLLNGSSSELANTATGGQPPQTGNGGGQNNVGGNTKDTGQNPYPTNHLQTGFNINHPNSPEPIYQQYSDGSWRYTGQNTGGG